MAASAEGHNIAVFTDVDDIEDDDTDPLIPDVVVDGEDDDPDPGDSDTDSDDADTNSTIPNTATPAARPSIISSNSAAASFAVSIPTAAVSNGGPSAPLYDGIIATTSTLTAAATTTTPVTPDLKRQRIDDQLIMTEKKPIVEDSRRLFQRLWTDEDEIELLQGFLEYTTQRSTTSSGHHHHDTAAFYDQIKSKLQLDCNKSQLVEKLRRLKKKYRNIVNRINSGKEFVFKSPHDQATFEISRKIWSNSAVNRQELEDDDQQNPNPSCLTDNNLPNLNLCDQNLNNSADNRIMVKTTTTTSNMNTSTPASKPRKRSRVKMEENLNLNQNENQTPAAVRNANFGGYEAVVNVNSMQGLIDETVKNCLSPLLKEVVQNAANGLRGVGAAGAGGGGGAKGIESLAMNAIPLNFSGLALGTGGELVDERWRRQQILELEVYSKRLELVQDQIKSTLEELRSM